MSHTKEPWATHEGDDDVIVATSDPHVSLLSVKDGTFGCFWNPEDASRAVACVNACAGISTEVLEHGPDNVFIYAKDVTKQRDELLAALQEARKGYADLATESQNPDEVEWAEKHRDLIDAAIRKGGAT